MRADEVAQYLRISIAKVYQLVRDKKLPFYNNHGFLRFYKEEIDNWMKTPPEKPVKNLNKLAIPKDIVLYRGRPILDYSLTASKILIGTAAWNRLPKFIEKFLDRSQKAGGSLLREDILEIIKNANDYLRVSYQLGLIGKRKLNGRRKEYYPTETLKKLETNDTESSLRNIICDSILQVAKDKTESTPDERHCLYLLWFYLSLLKINCSIDNSYFIRKQSEEHSYYPMIRHSFIKSFYEFLFKNDRQKAMEFYDKWIATIQ